jgi:hypothetical protein
MFRLAGRDDDGLGRAEAPPPGATTRPDDAPPSPAARLPDRSAFPAVAGDNAPAERRRVVEVLVDLADRCGVPLPSARDPAALMEALARDLHYGGPFLSDAELRQLDTTGAADREADLARSWHAAVLRFAPDRPLPPPAAFRAGPLRWQLAVLAWSFHVDDAVIFPGQAGPRRSAAEVAQALAAALAVDVPVRPLALAESYPALASYRAFLARLPRP